MIEPHGEENQIVGDLLKGVAISIQENPRLSSENIRYFTEIKLQKLLYIAVDEYDLPVTYSWYLAGAMLESGEASISKLEQLDEFQEGSQRSISSTPEPVLSPLTHENRDSDIFEVLQEIKRLDSPNPHINSRNDYQDPELYARFYSRFIESVWYCDRFEFLKAFYEIFCPNKYKNLYLESVELRELLNKIRNDIEGGGSVQSSLYDFKKESTTDIPDRTEELERTMNNIGFELINDFELEKTVTTFDKFAELLIDVYRSIIVNDLCDSPENCIQILEDMDYFFYNQTWQHPCLIISKNTATGPSEAKVVKDRRERLDNFVRNYQRRIESLKTKCVEKGILDPAVGK